MRDVCKIFETERLNLRPPAMEDAHVIFSRYAQDAEVTRYLLWRPHTDIAETRAFLKKCLDAWASAEEFTWVIQLSGLSEPIGMVAARPRGHRAEVGYVLARPYWGKGYMTEALSQVVDSLLSFSGLSRVWAVCNVENPASARVMEKAGMTCEGILRRWNVFPNISSEPRDCHVYARVL
ncbi:MAG: GNAT family N-acetyltransferase [bacterium]|nr:GNAT family N-acetyltransferase [bacterium]